MAKVFCFGNTSNGELGLGGIEDEQILLPRKQKSSVDCRKYSVKQLCSGRNHTLVLFRNESDDTNVVLSCGSNERNQLGREGSWKRLEPIESLRNHTVIRICCGSNHSLALTEAGQIFGWGCNLFGQLGIGNTIDESIGKPSLIKRLAAETVVQIACGGNHSLALTKTGLLYSWGSNAFGQLGIGTKGNVENSPVEVTALRSVPIRRLSCGGSHSAVLSYTGVLYVWGKNEFGQLGLNDTRNRSVPTVQTSLRSQRISFIDCGEEHSVALTADGGLFTWGAGMYGQLGHAKNNNEILPRRVFELMGNVVTQVSCGRCHTLASVGPKGRVYAFGLNGSGQLGIGTQISKSVPINVSGQWVELGVKDVSIRNMAGSLLPIIKESTTPNISNRNSPSRTVKSKAKSPSKNSDDGSDCSEMSIDELSDFEEENPSDITSSDETAIIEEPETEDKESQCYKMPSFVCTPNTIVSTEPDSISIDEYLTDPDSDCELTTERQHLVLKEIVASKGDQSFVLVVKLTDKSRPLDFRFNDGFEEIYRLDNKRFERFSDTKEDQNIETEDMEYIENALSSISCWNSSYIEYEPKTDSVLPSIDWKAAQMGFGLIETSKNSRIKDLIFQSILRLVPDLPNIFDRSSLDPEVLRVYLLLPLFHSFRTEFTNKEIMRKLIGGYLRAVLKLNDYAIDELIVWWSRMDDKRYKDLIQVIKGCIVELLDIQDKENQTQDKNQRFQIDANLHENLGLCLEFMAVLHKVNKKFNKISYKEFYIEGISDKFDLKMDYIHWLSARARNIQRLDGKKALYLCDFPFIFDPPAKTQILATDSAIQQQNAAESAIYRSLVPLPMFMGGGILMSNPYLVLSVSRSSILQETINQLCFRNSQNPSEFKKPLKVNFEGEEAIDAGIGMKKEFFLLLMKEILDKKFGMFNEYKDTNTIWFNPGDITEKDDLVMYQLIGIICGLAIYNQVIIYLPFPLVLYKKLLTESLDLEDLNYLDPILTKNLKDILETTYSEDEFNAIYSDIHFSITLTCFGSAVEYELEKGGKDKCLNFKNRADYIRLYWNFILNESVKQQFDAFKNGFNKVLDTGILDLFRAEELMQLVTGQEVYDWDLLETTTQYKEPFTRTHPTIVMFWKVFHSLTTEQKKKFLMFLTGSDRIPILGMKALKILIQPMKVSEDHLAVAHTCFNVLDLPEQYSCEDKLRQKLLQTLEHTQVFALA